MADDERYYSDEDPEHGVSREELARLSADEQREYVLDWFRRHYEDPANETPYQSSEGGYIFIWGGPYDAREAIENEFHDILNEELIQELVEQVESDGITDWAPGRDHPDHVRAAQEYEESMAALEPDFDLAIEAAASGRQPELGSGLETDLRKSLEANANSLLETLASLKGAHGGIGHNGPPIDDDGNPLPAEFEEGVREAAAIIREEAQSEAPNPLEIAKASKRLSELKKWLKPKADAAADEFAKAFGKSLGTGLGGVVCAAIGIAIASLLGISWDWLLTVLPGI